MNSKNLPRTICDILLNTIPMSYKDEAIEIYWEDTKENHVQEALQYFFGGIVYRLNRCKLKVIRNLSLILTFFRYHKELIRKMMNQYHRRVSKNRLIKTFNRHIKKEILMN